MNVVYLSVTGSVGGAERVLLDALASIRQLRPGWRLALVAAGEGELTEAASALGVATTVLPMPASLAELGDAGAGGPAGVEQGRLRLLGRLGVASLPVARYVRHLSSTIAALQPDLVHSNGFKTHLLGAWSVPASARLLWHIHDFLQARPLMPYLLRLHARRCAALVANSRSVADDARRTFGPGLAVHMVHNAVDLERFTPRGPMLELDAAAGLPPAAPGTIRVGLVATAARWKGHKFFLQALARLPQKGAPIRGYVIGGPIYQTAASQFTLDELRAEATALGLIGRAGSIDQVGFTGLVRDVPAALRALDIVVHASTVPEPFGLVIVEALACGRAVLTNASGGAGELIEAGHDAMTYPSGDVAGLAAAITALACDRALRERLGSAGRRTAEQRFARTRMGRELVAIYQTTIADQTGAGHAAAARP